MYFTENIATGFIHLSGSPCGAPVLFIQKKNSSLWLFIDFRGLNQISKKDQYLLPLISDLLDTPQKAQVYTKINLWHMYHLVCISKGDKWKTAFWTHYRSFEWLVMLECTTHAYMQVSHDLEVMWYVYIMKSMHAALKCTLTRNSTQRISAWTLNLHINEEAGAAAHTVSNKTVRMFGSFGLCI